MCCGPEADVQYAGGGPTIRIIWPGICLVFPNVRDKLQLFGSPRVLHSTCFFSSSSFRSCTFSSSNQLSCAINKHNLARKSDAWKLHSSAGRNPKSPPERECNCRGTTRSTFMRCCIPAHNPSIVGPMNGMRGDKLTREEKLMTLEISYLTLTLQFSRLEQFVSLMIWTSYKKTTGEER